MRRIFTLALLAGLIIAALMAVGKAHAQDRFSFGVDAQLVQYSLPDSAPQAFDARFTPKVWGSYSALSRTSISLAYEKGLGSVNPGLASLGMNLNLASTDNSDNLRVGVSIRGCHFDNADAIGMAEWDYSASLRASQRLVRLSGGEPLAYLKGFGEYFVISEKYRVGVGLGVDF